MLCSDLPTLTPPILAGARCWHSPMPPSTPRHLDLVYRGKAHLLLPLRRPGSPSAALPCSPVGHHGYRIPEKQGQVLRYLLCYKLTSVAQLVRSFRVELQVLSSIPCVPGIIPTF
jgi:hypothetical protein